MHALHNIHAALVPGGLLVDTQPIGGHPRVAADGAELGTLDMREWVGTIQAVDQRVDEAIAAGLFELTKAREVVVTSVFDDGPDCIDSLAGWQGTRIPRRLADRLAATRGEVAVEQRVRLRVVRRVPRAVVDGV